MKWKPWNIKKKSFGDYLLTFCFCFAVGLFHNPLETFVLGRGDLVPCIPFRMLLVFRACSHEQLVLWIFQHANPHRHKHTSWDCNCKNISHFKGVLPKTSENITTLRCGCLPGCLMRNAFKLWIWFWPFFCNLSLTGPSTLWKCITKTLEYPFKGLDQEV